MIRFLLGGAWRYLAGAVAILAGLFVVRKSGADAVKAKALKESAKKQKDGRNAAENMHGAGRAKWLEQLHKRRD